MLNSMSTRTMSCYCIILVVLLIILTLVFSPAHPQFEDEVREVENRIPDIANSDSFNLLNHQTSTHLPPLNKTVENIPDILQHNEDIFLQQTFTPLIVVGRNAVLRARDALEFFARTQTPVYVVPYDLDMKHIDVLRSYPGMVKFNYEIIAKEAEEFDSLSAQLHGLDFVLDLSPSSCILFIDLSTDLWDSARRLKHLQHKSVPCDEEEEAYAYRSSSRSTNVPSLPILAIPPHDRAARLHLKQWVQEHRACWARSFYKTKTGIPNKDECMKMASEFVLATFRYRYEETELFGKYEQ